MQEHCDAICFTDAQLEQMHLADHERMLTADEFSKLVLLAECHDKMPWALISRSDKCRWFCRYQMKNANRPLMTCYKDYKIPDTTPKAWSQWCKRVDAHILLESQMRSKATLSN